MTDETKTTDQLLVIRNSSISLVINEGSGIWQRFNFFVAIEIALLAGVAILFKDTHWSLALVAVALSEFRFVLTFNSMTVLDRMWAWHEAYVQSVRDVEEMLPEHLNRPFYNIKKMSSVNTNMPTRPTLRFSVTPVFRIFRVFTGTSLSAAELNWFTNRTTHKLLSGFHVLWICIALFSFATFLVEVF